MTTPSDAADNCGSSRCSTLPRAMVLVYQPELTHSVWQDLWHTRRSKSTLEKALRRGVREGQWVAWRLVYIEKEVRGNA